ncbi:MAG: methionine--tRNA ligase [Mollicutes bacterium PWAP]|nr:methionine--tRNA ligase [Mollicutes bacterium PWAP]
MNNKKTYYVTTPIYYPSGNPHIGTAYTTIIAWTLRNYKNLMGYDSKMATGTDEHGQKIQEKAKKQGISPQEYVDKMNIIYKNLWKDLEIDFDFYSRTTNKNHINAVKEQFSELLKNGNIYKDKYEGLYSISDEEFFTQKQAEKRENGKFYHPVSGHELVEVSEESYFLKNSKFSKWLNEYIFNNESFISNKKVLNELYKNFLEPGLKDLSITRTSFDWGIKTNEYDSHVIYVWLDALNNYITALGYKSNDDKNFKKYWENGDEIVHIVGKEITRFHCLYWPIILKASNIKQPTKILAHGWLITPEGKMSKSKGNVIDPHDLIQKYGVEETKYFFASLLPFGKDGIFSDEIMKNKLNSELSNNYGNLLSRTLAMVNQNFDEFVVYKKSNEKIDIEIEKNIIKYTNKYIQNFDQNKLDVAFNEIFKLGKKMNSYIDESKPWTLKKNKIRLEQILNRLINGVYAMTTMLSVVMPNKMKIAKEQLGIKELKIELINDFDKFNNIKVKRGEPLFKRIK